MAEAKKTTRTKKTSTKAAVPTAKSVAAEAKPQITPPAVKEAVKPVAAPVAKPAPAPVAKPVVAPAPVAKSAAAPKSEQKTISREEYTRMVEQAAYFKAEKSGFQGDSSQHWTSAEEEISADLKKRNIRVV